MYVRSAAFLSLLALVFCAKISRAAGENASSDPQSRAPLETSRPGVKDPHVQRPITTINPTFTLNTDGMPDWVAVSPDAVWFSRQADHTLNRIDPKTNAIVASVTIGKMPCSGMVYGFDSMWIPHCGEKALYRVDTKTNQVVARITVAPANSEGGLAATDDSIWILSDAKGTLSRIDPDTNRVVAEITTPVNCFDVASGFDSLWVTCTDSNLLLRINPANNLVEQRIRVGKGPRFLATGEGAVWTLNEVDGTVTRVDPKSNKAIATIVTGTPKAGDIAVGEGAVWVSSFDYPLTRIEPDTNTVTQQWEGRGGDAVRAAFGSIWLSGFKEGFIWRIDPKLL